VLEIDAALYRAAVKKTQTYKKLGKNEENMKVRL
jgi:hypothetical protein